MKQYPVAEERRMIAYYLALNGKITPKDGIDVEHFGDVREDDTSITILEG